MGGGREVGMQWCPHTKYLNKLWYINNRVKVYETITVTEEELHVAMLNDFQGIVKVKLYV